MARKFRMGVGVTGAAGQYIRLIDTDDDFDIRHTKGHSDWRKTDLDKITREVIRDEYAYREPPKETQEQQFLSHYYNTYQEFN